MGILDRLLRRKTDHNEWLAAHPGKGKMTMTEPIVSDAEQAATRARMEAEMDRKNHQNDPR